LNLDRSIEKIFYRLKKIESQEETDDNDNEIEAKFAKLRAARAKKTCPCSWVNLRTNYHDLIQLCSLISKLSMVKIHKYSTLYPKEFDFNIIEENLSIISNCK
jgi:hypothetical protein